MRTKKAARKKAGKLLWGIYRRGVLRGGEKPFRVLEMDCVSTDNFARGSSSWMNLYNRVKR